MRFHQLIGRLVAGYLRSLLRRVQSGASLGCAVVVLLGAALTSARGQAVSILASSPSLAGVEFLAFDSAGNLYASNSDNGFIQTISPTGSVAALEISGATSPAGLVLDSGGNIYVGDYNFGLVRKITPGGHYSVFASGTVHPEGLAFDSSGNLYVAQDTNTVSEVTSSGSVSTFAVGFNGPFGLAFDASGNLYVANISGGTVIKVTPSRTYSVFASGLSEPCGLAFDPAGNLYVSEYTSGAIVKISPAGQQSTYASVSGGANLLGMVSDSLGNLYVAGSLGSNGIIYKVSPAAPPAVTGVSPAVISTSGGTTLTITGTGFTGATSLSIGSQTVASSSFTVNGSTSITVTAPAESAGLVDITVTGPGGTSSTSAADQITYESSPTVTAISPNYGPASGGNTITVTGVNFVGATAVTVGGISTAFTYNSPTTLYVTMPAQTVGAQSVLVTAPGGTSAAGPTYTALNPATVTAVSPVAASTLGGTNLTITGTGFAGATSLTIGGQNLPSSAFTVNGDSAIAVTAPAESAGLVDITVSNLLGTSTTSASDKITYEGAPTVTGLSQRAGAPGGGNVITLTGTNFVGATAVEVGGTPAGSFTVNSPTQIYYTLPAESIGSYNVQVVTPAGTSSGLAANLYAYENAPTVVAISPASSGLAGGASATITGTNFTAASSVHFGSVAATTFTVNSPTVIFATVPAAAGPALVDVTVTNPTGTSSAVTNDQFTYLAPAPAFTSATTAGATAGQSFTYQSTDSNATGLSASGLPPGLTLNTATGTISGTPTTAGTYQVTLTLTGPGGTTTANLTITVAPPPLLSQTVTFPGTGGTLYVGGSVSLLATASSGLPVTYKIVSGSATLTTGTSGTSVSTTAGNQNVVVEADQAGNGVYSPASAQITLVATALSSPLVFTGSLTIQGSATSLRQPAASSATIAATVNAAQTAGTLLGYLPSLNAGFVANFTIGAGGTFSVSTPSLVASPAVSQTLTITGTVSGTTVTGSISPVGASFSLASDPVTGPSAAVAGFYTGSTLQSSAGGTYSIVGTQGDVVVLAISPTLVSAGTGTLSNNTFTVAGSSSATITGTLNPANTSITGSVSTPAAGTTNYSGVVATTPPAVRLINLSTRGLVTPTSPMTAGFVVGGTTNKTVLLRGVGPALASFGLSGVLAHPTLTLMTRAGAVVATNSGWAGATAVSTLSASAGAFPLAATSADSALVSTLAPGIYTVQVSDTAADSGGLALVEIYDTTVDLSGTTQKLAELSTIGPIGTGPNVLVAGFVIAGNTPKEVLVRGVGPTLAAFGITAAIADPVLVVYDNTGAMVAQNNDWATALQVGSTQITATAAQLVAAASQVGAFALATGSKDASLLVTLAPGAYTAQVSSGTAAAGTALVEIYEVSP